MQDVPEIVGRVAKAILARVPCGYGMTEAEAQDYARVAITAMRKPSKAMLDAAYAAHDAYENAPASESVAWCGLSSAFAAMIDAALSPAPATRIVST